MKRRIYGACAFVFYLLVLCLALSVKIDDEMSTEVVISPVEVNAKSEGYWYLSKETQYYAAEGGTLHVYLFEVAEGSGWNQGLRILEVPSTQYTMELDSIRFETTVSQNIVRLASRFPVEGAQATIITQEKATGQYLLAYPQVMYEYAQTSGSFTLLAEGTSARLVEIEESYTPFLEEQVSEMLTDLYAPNVRIFSLADIETFFRCLPWAALAGVLLLLTLPLWGWIFLLLGSPGQLRRVLLAAVAIGALVGAAMLALGQFDLPSSLMPTDNIFSLSYYRQEFEMIFDALRQVDPSGESAVYAAVAFARRWSIACAVFAAAAFLLLSAAPLLVRKCRPSA